MDIDKSIENGELSYSDRSFMRSFAVRTIALIGFILYGCFRILEEDITVGKVIATILLLALIYWVGKNAYINYTQGNKLLKITTKLTDVENLKIARKTIKRLHWKIKEENTEFLIATNNNDFDLVDYEVSVIFKDNQILFNYRSIWKGGASKSLFGPIENEKYRTIFEEEFQRQIKLLL